MFALRAASAAFDERWGATLERERAELAQIAELLIANGTTSISRPNGQVKATIRHKRFGASTFEIAGERHDGATRLSKGLLPHGSPDEPLTSLLLGLALLLTWLQELPPA